MTDLWMQAGMHSYLTKYAYQNTHTPQLWAELEEASGMPVGKVTEKLAKLHVNFKQYLF